jgi:tripartite-type tricarboxylate transporter receptor subunit TctC
MLKSLFLFLALSASAMAQELRIVTPSQADGYNINARMIAPYLAKYLPEKPVPIIQVVPGAFSLAAANHMYNIAPRDGNTIATVYKHIPFVGVLGGPTIMFDPSRFTWIGSSADGRKDAVMLWTNRSESLDHFFRNELLLGAESVISSADSKFIKQSIGLNIKHVFGYVPSGSRLALERKEIDAVIFSLIGTKTQTQWTSPDSKIRPLIQFGNGSNRHPNYKDVPTLTELLKNERDKQILSIFETQYILLRPFIAPPNIPSARVKELREAFTKAVTDEGYIREAAKANIEIDLITGEQAEMIVSVLANAPSDILKELRTLQSEK